MGYTVNFRKLAFMIARVLCFRGGNTSRFHLSRSSVTLFVGMLHENITSFKNSDLSYDFMIYLCFELKTFENSSHGQTIRVHSTRIT